MKMKSFLFLAGVLLITTFYSCKEIQPVTVSRPEGAKITRMDSKGVAAEISLRIKNPNKMGFNVYRSEIDVSLNDVLIGKARLKKRVRVSGNSDEIHVFYLETDASKLLEGGITTLVALLQKKSISLGVRGDIKVGKLFYKKTFPINVKERVPLSR